MTGGPDIVEELYLDDRLQAARRHANGAPDDVRFGERRVEDARAAETTLQIRRHLEDAAFALDLFEILLARAIRHVLAEDDDARITRQLFVQTAIDQIGHRAFFAFKHDALFRVELRRSRIYVGRIDEIGRGLWLGLRTGERFVGRRIHRRINFIFD